MKKSVKVILCLFGMNYKVTFTCRAQASRLRIHRSEVLNLGKGVQSKWWFCRQTSMPC